MRPSAPADASWSPRFFEKSALFSPLGELARAFANEDDWPSVSAIDRALSARAAVRFEEQAPKSRRQKRSTLAPARLYDARIYLEGVVPTRAQNWHDLLNALVWNAFPKSKAALHARQYAAIVARIAPGAKTLPPTRTRELDGLALVDEGGLVLLAEPDVSETMTRALESGDAQPIHEAIRQKRAEALIFGHAVYEHLVRAAPAVRATTHLVALPGRLPESTEERVRVGDAALARALTEGAFSDPARARSLPVTEALARPR